VSEHREPSRMIGDFLREAAVLIAVLWPLEDGIQNHRVSGTVLLFALLSASILVFWGIILEGRDEL
jgi:hypothetical protein